MTSLLRTLLIIVSVAVVFCLSIAVDSSHNHMFNVTILSVIVLLLTELLNRIEDRLDAESFQTFAVGVGQILAKHFA